ncbi:AAA family ATPase [Candidatus Rariloculus sp.]|uniref:AAA family ATPase n=1 Tax=Candidatus Rariloculus sp. TaxID=3101265 RepID=UPI003D0B19E6
MSDLLLKELDVTNFRSICGHVHAPLDAKVVLVHGKNGSGKTSLLSAIELALTGSIQSLWRADPDYERHLLHRSSNHGNVTIQTKGADGEQRYEAFLDETGAHPIAALEQQLAAFFGERTYLPQSLLGQLLQIYQESGSDADSPLARFVGDLLGLDRLDALEAGLKPLTDVRNVRKVVDGWSQTEIEKNRLDKLLDDQQSARAGLAETLENAIKELSGICTKLELSVEVREQTLEAVSANLSQNKDEAAFDRLTDQHRHLASIRRELADSGSGATQDGALSPAAAVEASSAYASWESAHGARFFGLRNQIETLLPLASLPSDHAAFGAEALPLLRSEGKRLSDQAEQARVDLERVAIARGEIEIARRQRATIDEEISRIPKSAGNLSVVLSELSSYIDGEVCPVCERDFIELESDRLADHLHEKVRRLSASGERLLTLGRSRSEQQVIVERLEREIAALEARVLDAKSLAAIDRQSAALNQAVMELHALTATLAEGARLRASDVAARRAVSKAHSRDAALAAARETLSEFALSLATVGVADEETFGSAAARLEDLLSGETTRLDGRLALRRKGNDLLTTIQNNMTRRGEIDAAIAGYQHMRQRADKALRRAQALRQQGISIRNAVDTVRSAIIRREFNDRLNRVWRDLFVRLAPGEPFVPAFRIPPSSTQRLQPKLITEYRDGGEAGGTPGAMLSAGNLNTAALTLFIALHLSVPKALPWLILDDPVQSMDDMHITHFASLLRTLSKEHGRQIVLSVHDHQLFEYLRLELSPAFADDSLLTLELSRRPHRDTLCLSQRLRFQEETALQLVA